MSQELGNVTNGINSKAISTDDAAVIRKRTKSINDFAANNQIPIHLTSVDLEYTILSELTDARADEFGASMNLGSRGRDVLAARLGSKGGEGPPSSKPGSKAPYIRAALASFVRWDEVPLETKDLLWRWSLPAQVGATLARPNELK